MQVNEDYYEDLNDKKLEEIIETIYQNKIPKPGSYSGRINAEPVNNRKTLLGIDMKTVDIEKKDNVNLFKAMNIAQHQLENQ